MNLEYIALIISGLAFIGSIISLVLASQANKIEENRDTIELEKGKTALLTLTCRYFILNLQRTDFIGTTFRVKDDSNFTSNYIEELEFIASLFDNLINSSYYTVLYKKYSMIGVMPTFIRKEIMYIKSYNSKGKQYGFDNVVWKKMFSTLEILRKEIKLDNNELNDVFNNEIFNNAKQINDFLISKR